MNMEEAIRLLRETMDDGDDILGSVLDAIEGGGWETQRQFLHEPVTLHRFVGPWKKDAS